MFKLPIIGLCMCGTFACLFFLRGNVVIVTAAVALLGAIMLASNWSLEYLVTYLAMFTVGVILELTSVREHLWIYPDANMFGIPLWIPFMWSNGALAVLEFKESIDRFLARYPRKR